MFLFIFILIKVWNLIDFLKKAGVTVLDDLNICIADNFYMFLYFQYLFVDY